MVQVWSMLASGDGRPRHHRPAEPAAAAVDDRVGHLHPLPRRHRLGHRRHRRLAGRAQRPRPPAVPRRLVRRRAPRLVGPRAGVPGERGHRRPPDQRARSRRWPAASADDPGAVARILLAHAVVLGFGGLPGALDGRRARPAQRPGLGRRTRPRRRQPLGAPAADAVAGADRHRRHPRGPRPPARRPQAAAPPARRPPDRDLGPPRPRGAARRPPLARPARCSRRRT